MNVLIVYAHPEPKSFNGALKDLAVSVLTEKGHAVQVSDLYAMNWKAVHDKADFLELEDPTHLRLQREERHAVEKGLLTPDVKAEQEKLKWADAVILQTPLWWFSLPAILKGWVDRVLTSGFAYGPGRHYDAADFRGKRAMLSVTVGAPQVTFGPRGRHGDINVILWPIQHGILHFAGFDVLQPFVSWGPHGSTASKRREFLEFYRERLVDLFTSEPVWFHLNSEFEGGQLRPGLKGKTVGQHS